MNFTTGRPLKSIHGLLVSHIPLNNKHEFYPVIFKNSSQITTELTKNELLNEAGKLIRENINVMLWNKVKTSNINIAIKKIVSLVKYV